jgi:hypothetical protein
MLFAGAAISSGLGSKVAPAAGHAASDESSTEQSTAQNDLDFLVFIGEFVMSRSLLSENHKLASCDGTVEMLRPHRHKHERATKVAADVTRRWQAGNGWAALKV